MTRTANIEVFYDADCPICRAEIKFYKRIDKNNLIVWTDITTLKHDDLPEGKTHDDLLGKFHVRDVTVAIVQKTQWHVGVDAFARIWKVLPGFRYFAFIFRLPIIRQLAIIGYKIFLKYQQANRVKRASR